jgi:low affinity Fe/Cu permease
MDDNAHATSGAKAVHANAAHARGANAVPPAPPPAPAPRGEVFRRFAHRVSNVVGSPGTFIAAVVLIVVWAATGPFMHYSTTWQLIVNTGTTILTFLMVFLIQNSQNRDARAIHLKLDELIKGVKGARNAAIDLEDRTEEELMQLEQEFKRLHEREAHAQKRRTEAKEREAQAAEKQAELEERAARDANADTRA